MKRILALIGVAIAVSAAAQPVAAAPPQDVAVNSTFIGIGDLSAGTTGGTFCISGAISDCGTLTGDYRFAGLGHLRTGDPNSIHADQTLTGRNGTIAIAIDGLYGPFVDGVTTGSGRWVVVSGTGAYAGLHGEGSWTATADFTAAFAGTGPPVVVHVDTGQVHWT
jgi:hypothetical protein